MKKLCSMSWSKPGKTGGALAEMPVEMVIKSRAAVMRAWMDSDFYRVFQEMGSDLYERAVRDVLVATKDTFEERKGYANGLARMLRVAERAIADERGLR